MSADRIATVGRAFGRVALPLATYYAVTVVVPLLNGAASGAMFVRHTLAVLVVPPILVLLLCIVRAAIADGHDDGTELGEGATDA
jgi:hypothetical protein